jgi:RNA polymerase sigma-70 factor (ECF subfamily)
VTIHGARATYDPSRSFVAWLTAITQRRTIDLLRKRGRRGAHEVYAPDVLDTHAGDDNPERDAVRQSEAVQLHAFVADRLTGSARRSGCWRLKKIRSKMHPKRPAGRNHH